MKNGIISFICTLIVTISFSKDIFIPDIKYLQNKKISMTCIVAGSTIEFMSDTKYKIEYGSEGWYWFNEGVYVIRDGKIYLTPTKCLESENGIKIECSDSMGEAVCELFENENSLEYLYGLRVKSIKGEKIHTSTASKRRNYIEYDIKDFPVEKGAKRVIDGIPVIVMGGISGRTNDNVKIRKKPSITAESVNYEVDLYGIDNPPQDFVPKMTEIIILARTLEKEKVHKWNNYWYYVKVGINNGVWMFGEFINIY